MQKSFPGQQESINHGGFKPVVPDVPLVPAKKDREGLFLISPPPPPPLYGGNFHRNDVIRSALGDAIKMVGKALQCGFPLIEIVVVVVSSLDTFERMIEDTLGNFR